MPLPDAFIGAERKQKDRVMTDTWGHLMPEGGATIIGKITVAMTQYDGMVILKEDIKIDGSPWWYEAIHLWMEEQEFEDQLHVGDIRKIEIIVRCFSEKSRDGLAEKRWLEIEEYE